jgi:hypothetical protein
MDDNPNGNFGDYLNQFFNGSYKNVNPNTDSIMQTLTAALGGAQNNANGAYGSMAGLIGQANGWDPTAFLKQFMQNAPGLESLANQDYSDMMKGAQDVGNKAVQDVAGQFAGLGSLYSGGAASNATEALANPMMAAYNAAQGNRSSLLSSLFGGAMSGLNSGNQAYLSSLLQGAGLYGQQGAANTGLYGDVLSQLAGYGTPTYAAQPGFLDNIKNILGIFTSAAGLPGGGSSSSTPSATALASPSGARPYGYGTSVYGASNPYVPPGGVDPRSCH